MQEKNKRQMLTLKGQGKTKKLTALGTVLLLRECRESERAVFAPADYTYKQFQQHILTITDNITNRIIS